MRTLMTFVTTVVLLAVLTTPLLAAVTHSGGGVLKVTVVTETNASATINDGTYMQLPGAIVNITVPAGTTQLVRASFTAESACEAGAAGNYCTVRIVAVNAAGSITELSPKSGFDYAFDTVQAAEEDGWEGHAMDRSIVLGPGNYAIRVQWGIVNKGGITTFRLDDWSFTVEQHSNGL